MYIILKEGQKPVKPEEYGCQHPEELYHVLSGIITGYGPFNHHELI